SLLIGVVLLLLRIAIPPNCAEQRPHAGADGSASSRISTYSASNRAKGGTAERSAVHPRGRRCRGLWYRRRNCGVEARLLRGPLTALILVLVLLGLTLAPVGVNELLLGPGGVGDSQHEEPYGEGALPIWHRNLLSLNFGQPISKLCSACGRRVNLTYGFRTSSHFGRLPA